MKKLFVLFVVSLFAFMANAQEHMKFMGIPLDGTISNFNSKLLSKGIKVHPNNSHASTGQKWYVGTFFGEDAEIYVYFNPKTQIVYRAKAVIDRPDVDHLKSVFTNVSTSIENKYEATRFDDIQNGYEACEFDISSSGSIIGEIDLYTFEYGVGYNKRYYFNIDYIDAQGRKEYLESIDDDI